MYQMTVTEVKQTALEILLHIDTFCKNNGVRYFLSGGTLLGAIRHHGFIPWDDDIDIMMLRPDYEHFVSLYQEKDHSVYKIHSCEFDHHFNAPFIKVDDTRTVYKEHINKPNNIGVHIDVFPIDDLPDNEHKRLNLYRRAKWLINLYNLKQVKINRQRSLLKNFVLLVGRCLISPIPISTVVRRLATLPKSFTAPRSSYCGVVVWGYGEREINHKSNYSRSIDVLFEGHSLPAPVGFDDYLKSLYGNYLQLPPEGKRVSHHSYDAFRVY